MENMIGTPMTPMITIINNTDEEIYNVSISFTYKTVNYIPFNKIPAHCTCKSVISLKDINVPISLLLNYSHNEITENQLILKSLKKSANIISITLEINIENGSYVTTTIIERDTIDTSIQLSHTDNNDLLKSICLVSTLIVIPSLCCLLLIRRHCKKN